MKDAIFLSASVPDPKRHAEFAATADSIAIASAVSALLYVTLGRRPLVWGGHPAITPMVVEMCDGIDVDYGRWVRLYQSTFFKEQYPEENERFQNTVYTELGEDGTLEASLSTMRLQMLRDHTFIAGIFVGGMQGVIDEGRIFMELQPAAPVFPIASTGGAALSLAERLTDVPEGLHTNLEYVGLFHRLLGISEKERRYSDPEQQPADLAEREVGQPGDLV